MTAEQLPFSRRRSVQCMLDVEVALVEALAECGLVAMTSVDAIRAAARVDRFDLDLLAREAEDAGNPLIPLVGHLKRLVADHDKAAAGLVHWGATSQDVMDTALVLQLRETGAGITETLQRGADAAASLAERYAASPIAGRTWLQQATPTTFGVKAAGWMQALDHANARLSAALDAATELQFGGATGTLSSLGHDGAAVARALAARLGLRVTDVAWHTDRSRLVDVACALGLACGSLGKIGRDVSLLAQTEVAEVSEPAAPGRGGSSSMPHKRNPVASARALAAAVRAPGLVAIMLAAMPQEHERALGGWQAEWETLPALAVLTADASAAMARALPGLAVDEARMRRNLDAAGAVARAEGLVAALAPHAGRDEAIRTVEDLCRQVAASGGQLSGVAAGDERVRAHLTAAQVEAALDPSLLSANAREIVRLALERRRQRRGVDHG